VTSAHDFAGYFETAAGVDRQRREFAGYIWTARALTGGEFAGVTRDVIARTLQATFRPLPASTGKKICGLYLDGRGH
jgi:hypothetical protein